MCMHHMCMQIKREQIFNFLELLQKLRKFSNNIQIVHCQNMPFLLSSKYTYIGQTNKAQ